MTSVEVNAKQEVSEESYNEIKSVFERGEWDGTLKQVDDFRAKYPRSPYSSSVTFLAAQAALKSRDITRARVEAFRITLKFPESTYVDDARLILAECALLNDELDDAESLFNWVVGFATDRQLAETAKSRLDELRAYREAVIRMNSKTVRSIEAEVGLILPLTGDASESASAFLKGFLWHWQRTGRPEPVVWDSEGDPIKSVRLCQRIVSETPVKVVVGGLESDETIALALSAGYAGIPFVTTLYPNSGISIVNSYVFQGRPSNYRIGQALGEWAVNERGLSKLAVLYPMTRNGRQIASGFQEAVRSFGAMVVAEETYYSGTIDFSPHLRQFRSGAIRMAFNDSVRIADGDLALSQDYLDSLWSENSSRVRRWMVSTGRDIDSLAVPVSYIEGMLVISESGSIEIFASQFAKFNFNTQLLGNDVWDDREALGRISRYVDGIVFATPFYPDDSDEYYLFASRCADEEYGGKLLPAHFAGERAARMAEFGLNRSKDRNETRNSLTLIRDLRTLSGRVSLVKEEREDRNVTLVQFRNGALSLINP